MKKVLLSLTFILCFAGMVFSQQTRPKIAQMELAPGEFYTIVTDGDGIQTYELIRDESIESFQILGDSLCISVVDSWTGDPLGEFCVAMVDPDPAMYVDSVYTVTSQTFEHGLPIPARDDYWELFLNGVRLAEPFDWLIDGANVQLIFQNITTDRVVIRYPE